MIEVDRTYTDNPFVDNMIYYAKLLALNCTIKDEQTALDNETVASKRLGDILIQCIEGSVHYELFPFYPKELLSKYIQERSNLDIYVEDQDALNTYLYDLNEVDRVNLYTNICNLAQTVYVDHYDIMTNYLDILEDNWLENRADLYEDCKNHTSDIIRLFYEIPQYTRERILKYYLSYYQNSLAEDYMNLYNYINSRPNTTIDNEMDNIHRAMEAVFASHYEMMQERGYISEDNAKMHRYRSYSSIFSKCKANDINCIELFPYFPEDQIRIALESCLTNIADIDTYSLTQQADVLENYFKMVSNNPEEEMEALNSKMISMYMENYNLFIDEEIYDRCIVDTISYWELQQYIPDETIKMILNTYIEEYTNLELYENSKNSLNEYLARLDSDERNRIRNALAADMKSWFPANVTELNPYYRALIGKPPLDDRYNEFEDTLVHTYDEVSKTYIDFEDEFLNMIPDTIYPEAHWQQPLSQFDNYDISMLKEYGVIDAYKEACRTRNINANNTRYKYLEYLGDDKLDLYTCRKANRFELIGVPTLDDSDARDLFIEKYALNRDYILRTVYADAYKFESDYYDRFIMVFILVNTIMDMLVAIPENIIDRKVFDARCVKYLFESMGIPFYSEIPLKYQKAMIKNLNILIKYKSSQRNMVDICSLFGFDDVKVFSYYLFKDRNTDSSTGEYEFDETNDITYDPEVLYIKDEFGNYSDYYGRKYSRVMELDNSDDYFHSVQVKDHVGDFYTKKVMNNNIDFYVVDPYDGLEFIRVKDLDYFTKIQASTEPSELKFIRVPIGESITEYKNNPDYISTYDEIVTADEGNTWDGGEDHDLLKKKILDYEFNAVRSKYISIETITEATELSFQVGYFYNMLFDNFYSEDALTVDIPYIKIGHKFRFSDIVCYLFALMYLYNGLKDNIMYSPTQILYVKGYNFNDDLNEIFSDPKAFQQTDPITGEELRADQKYNIFDVNKRIAEDGYNYREAFGADRIQAFNLEADMDEIEKWLNDNFQMSLDDFVVDDSLTEFDQIITLRSFFSLNNSYYQKDIFKPSLAPLAYNNAIKYAYDYTLYRKIAKYDMNGNRFYYINKNDKLYYMYDSSSKPICIMDYNIYGNYKEKDYSIYYPYNINNGILRKATMFPYWNDNGKIKPIFDGSIYVRNQDNNYIFAADKFYRMNNSGVYEEITEDRFFITDPFDTSKKILLFGEYYIQSGDNWVLNPNNCYVKTEHNGVYSYVLARDITSVISDELPEDRLYIRHSDGHFIRLSDTDYYVPTDTIGDLVLKEEECFVVSNTETEYFDPTANPIVYYTKLTDFYNENSSVIIYNPFFVKIGDEYIPESELITPGNCYYLNAGEYRLITKDFLTYKNYITPYQVDYLLILNEDNNYDRFYPKAQNYNIEYDFGRFFVYNSDQRFALEYAAEKQYTNTNQMIVSFNKYTSAESLSEEVQDTFTGYNPEASDKVWDENDWFYEDPYIFPDRPDNMPIGIHGENMWYYKKPGQEEEPEEEETESVELIGSGFYCESATYIGDIALEPGQKYYMSMDIQTNFGGILQVSNEADASCQSSADRSYGVVKDEITHVNQIFTANNITHPTIRFLMYNYDTNPIEIGDYIIVSNVRFTKSYSDNFIPQDIPSYDKLRELYRTNAAISKYLSKLMSEESDYKMYSIYKHLYDSLMTAQYNKEAFKIGDNTYARTYTEFLETRDATLYEKLEYFKTLDSTAMHKEIADNIIEITYALDGIIDTYSYGYLYSYFPAVSANYIQQYISKIINFFKSWKVHLLGINTLYRFDDPVHNSIKVLEDEEYFIDLNPTDNIHVYDAVKLNPSDGIACNGQPYSIVFGDEWTNITHEYSDNCRPKDRVRITAYHGNKVLYTKNYEEEHILFDTDYHSADGSTGELIINSESAEFTADENNLIMTDNYTDHDMSEHISINEIGNNTIDITGGK